MDNKFHTLDLSQYSFLITGGAGFIGSNLTEYLVQNDAGKVLVLDDLSTGNMDNIQQLMQNSNFSFMEGDICNPDICQKACEGIDYVLHQAALGSVPRSIENPARTNAVNISGFVNMLVAARDAKVKRFIYAASSSTYGDIEALPKVEDNIGQPLSPYAVTKLVNELYADVFSTLYGIEVIGLRYFNVYGPKQNPKGPYAAVIPLYIEAFLNNSSLAIFGDGEQTRDFTYVENVINANIKAIETQNQDAVNQVYNVAVGERCSVNHLYDYLKEIDGSEIEIVYKEERIGEVKHSLADVSKAVQLIGYEPTVKLKEGLTRTYNWFKEKEVLAQD